LTKFYWVEFSWLNIINVLGSLALFIYGLKVMSDGIQRAAGKALRSFLNKMTSNKAMALFTGFIITSLIQSSSASTVLTVGFVNAGLLNLSQSLGVIFGINIGTTVTGWIISVLGIQLNSYQTVLPMLILSIPLLFSKRKLLNAWGDFLMGFFLLLIGLFFMRDNVPDFSLISSNFSILENLAEYGYASSFIFILFGVLTTVILQSSTATMALTLVLCNKGWLPFDISAAMILGANIGTTSTAEIAAIIGNVSARRSARIHTLLNVFGSVWAWALLPLLLKAVDFIGLNIFYDKSAFLEEKSVPIALAIFHSIFNILNVALFMLFPRLLVVAAIKTIRTGKSVTDEKYTTNPLSDNFNLPELTILGAQREVAKFASITKKMNNLVTRMVIETESDSRNNCYQMIVKNEDIIDQFEKTLSNYLTESLSVEVTSGISHKITALQNICHEFERVGDLYLDMANQLKEKNDNNIWFNTQQRTQVHSMLLILNKQHKILIDALKEGVAEILIKSEISVLHEELKNISRVNNKASVEHTESHPHSNKYFDTLSIIVDNISDHLYSVSRLVIKNL
jgi:phosphate:Na+ symporter